MIGGPPSPSCPYCATPANPSRAPQSCARCKKSFGLYPGYALDPSVVPPPPNMGADTIKVKYGATFTYRFAVLEPVGVAEGVLDPVTGLLPLDKVGVTFPDVLTIAIWRTVDWLLLVMVVLVLAPITALFLFASFSIPGLLFLSLPLAFLTGFSVYRAIVVRKHHARIVGRYAAITVRFDQPFWKRRRFHDELLRRTGLAAQPIP